MDDRFVRAAGMRDARAAVEEIVGEARAQPEWQDGVEQIAAGGDIHADSMPPPREQIARRREDVPGLSALARPGDQISARRDYAPQVRQSRHNGTLLLVLSAHQRALCVC